MLDGVQILLSQARVGVLVTLAHTLGIFQNTLLEKK